MEKGHLLVSSSPHIRSAQSTQRIMVDVLIALVPALFCGVVYFGLRVLLLAAISVLSCVLLEYAWQKFCKKTVTVSDGSAVVTGLILVLNMPVIAPWWLPVVGSFFAIIIVKQLFGGVGCNFLNPAAAGRAFLMASWPVLMTQFVSPFTNLNPDIVTSATPLTMIKGGEIAALPGLKDMFLGNIGGCMGETSALAILIGGAYLLIRGVISPRIPLAYVGTVAVLAFIFPSAGLNSFDSALYHVLGGGLLFGAVFMATDYVTSPMVPWCRIIMGIGCGVITFMIRRFGGYPEGVTYAIILMNIVTPLLDKYCRPKPFGFVKEKA